MADNKYLTVSPTEEERNRIFSYIVADPETGCWNWNGIVSDKGYGRLKFRGRMESAHRVLYAWMRGPIPRGVGSDIPTLDHFICDNPRCCNPEHLRLVTQRENILRGNNRAARNSRKTHCPKGHLLEQGKKQRFCPVCRRDNVRNSRLRHPSTKEQKRKAVERVREWRKIHPKHGGLP